MKKRKNIALDFFIDKLTNSIENVQTGDTFATNITLLSFADLKTINKKMVGSLIGSMNSSNLKERFINSQFQITPQ